MSEAPSAIEAASCARRRSIRLSPVMKEVGRRTVLCFGLASGTLSLLGRDAQADDSAKRKRSTASVTSFPYSVPRAGQALLIGNNFAADVRPPSHSAHQWNYALFLSYGGGTYVEDYSAGGAYVIAGSGGHAHPPNFGGCLFDFADATWKRIDNANGMPWRNRDLDSPEINRFGEISYPDVSDGIPAPAHLYGNVLPLSAANGGGSRGSALLLRSQAAGASSNHGSGYAHRFDLSTGLWTRQSTNAAIGGRSPYRTACYDRATNRYYMIRQYLHGSGNLDYLDGADWTWKTVGIGRPAPDGDNKSAFIDDSRRLLIMQTSTGKLRAIDLNDMRSGPVTLRTAGDLPRVNQSQWHLYPADGCWYTYVGNGGNDVYKIEPPAANPLANTWTVSTVVIGGAALPSQPAAAIKSGAVHNTRFFYVRPLGCFAWIAGGSNQVAILKP